LPPRRLPFSLFVPKQTFGYSIAESRRVRTDAGPVRQQVPALCAAHGRSFQPDSWAPVAPGPARGLKLSTNVVELPSRERWTPERAEAVLTELEHVVACRLVTGEHGRVIETHVLATDAVPAKEIVRNIEAALFVHFGRSIDHRKISVAQVSEGRSELKGRQKEPPSWGPPDPGPQGRMVLLGHQLIGERGHRVVVRVTIEYLGRRFEGSAQGADVAPSSLEILAKATLRAIEVAAWSELEPQGRAPISLHLEGVSAVGGAEHPSLLVSVSAANGREVTRLAGAVSAAESRPRAAILASMQATDRWVRGQLSS